MAIKQKQKGFAGAFMTVVFPIIAFLGVSFPASFVSAAAPSYCSNSFHRCFITDTCNGQSDWLHVSECDAYCAGLITASTLPYSCWQLPPKITESHTCGSVQATCIYDGDATSDPGVCASLSPAQKYDTSCLSSCPEKSSDGAPMFPNACVPLSNNGSCDTAEHKCVTPPQVCGSGYTQATGSCKDACPGTNEIYCAKNAGNNPGPGQDPGPGGDCNGMANFEKIGGVCFPTDSGLPDPQGGILQILNNFFAWLLLIFGLLSLGAFMISGIQYLIASGDEDLAKTAKRNMKFSLVGIIVGLSGYVIMQAVFNALSANPFF